ncbi:MAG: hypothetical protein P4M00_06375 [Azospirillaceae bacterium]|nr:hypothetical protein [Azospirillaceae bacterium]
MRLRNDRRKSAEQWCRIAALFWVALTAACSDLPGKTELLGADPSAEPPPGVPIRRITEERLTWPNLASVPPRPTNVSTVQTRQGEMTSLASERTQADQMSAENRAAIEQFAATHPGVAARPATSAAAGTTAAALPPPAAGPAPAGASTAPVTAKPLLPTIPMQGPPPTADSYQLPDAPPTLSSAP